METRIDEIAPDIYRLATYIEKIDLQFNQFLVNDEEPLLYHTGLRGMFPLVRGAVARIVEPTKLRWIGFSHFESDECGSLNEWRAAAPHVEPLCGVVGALVNINDFVAGRARVMAHGETISTGRYRFRFLETPHVPHGWDASLLFEETASILFSSDLFLQNGDLEALTGESVVEAARKALEGYEAGPLAHPYPYTPLMRGTMQTLADLSPALIAVMHGASYRGDGKKALLDLADVFVERLGPAGQGPCRER